MEQTKMNVRTHSKISARQCVLLLTCLVTGFLIGRVNIGGDIWPFGSAFVAASFLNSKKINPYVAFFGVLAALLTNFEFIRDIGFPIAITGTTAAIMIFIKNTNLKLNRLAALVALLISYLVCAICFMLIFPMNLLIIAVEFVISCVVCIVADSAIGVIWGKKRTLLTDEEAISISFVILLAVLGLGGISVMGVTLSNVVALYFTCMAAYLGGAGVGAGCGIAMGIATMLGGGGAEMMLALGCVGLTSGAVNKMKKPGVSVCAVIVFFVVLTVYHENIMPLSMMLTCILSIGAFFATPAKACSFMGKYVDANMLRLNEQTIHSQRFRELTVGRLREISTLFENAGGVFTDSSCPDVSEDVRFILAKIPERVCSNCVFFSGCWEREFRRSYLVLLKLYEKHKRGIALREKDLGPILERRCLRTDKFLACTKEVFRGYATNVRWEQKVQESRQAVADQLKGVAKVIDELAGEVDMEIRFSDTHEHDIRSELDRAGVRVREVCARMLKGNLQIDVGLRECSELLEKKIARAISHASGENMHVAQSRNVQGMVILRYEKIRRYSLNTAVCALSKTPGTVSGDAHSIVSLKDARTMMLLCDGMGSGERAAKESRAAVSLVEDFLAAGFPEEAILSAINKLLLLSSSDEMFSTLDMCMFDLMNGKASFTKIGAPHSYLCRNGKLMKIEAGALPLGILDEFTPAVASIQLEQGDLLLMFSDGITEVEDADERMEDVIVNASEFTSEREIADYIIGCAKSLVREDDDMTIMVARVVKNKLAS